MIPYEMIHGRLRKGKKCCNERDGNLVAKPLWNNEVERIFFDQTS